MNKHRQIMLPIEARHEYEADSIMIFMRTEQHYWMEYYKDRHHYPPPTTVEQMPSCWEPV